MFRLMRNVHLALGLAFFFFAALFAVSSLTIIYRPWLPAAREETSASVAIERADAASPRMLAAALMRREGLRGELRNIEQSDSGWSFRIVRPGTETRVEYAPGASEAKIETRRYNFLETLIQLHVNHGFWHEFWPSNLWAAASLLASLGLFALGATGIYLWFAHHKERLIGGALLAAGLLYGFATLWLTRTA